MEPYFEEEGIAIYHGDAVESLAALANADQGYQVFDHLITDPPYSAHVHAKSRSGSAISEDVDLGFDSLTDETRAAIVALVAEHVQRWSLIFSDAERVHLWREQLEVAGVDHVRTGAWVKLGATPQFTGDRPAAGFEAIEVAHRSGKKKWNGGGAHGVWSFGIARAQGGGRHPTQKPLDLMQRLIEQFTDPGDLIVDPFCGSGTTLLAAKNMRRRAIGIEAQEKWCAFAKARLSQGVLF